MNDIQLALVISSLLSILLSLIQITSKVKPFENETQSAILPAQFMINSLYSVSKFS